MSYMAVQSFFKYNFGDTPLKEKLNFKPCTWKLEIRDIVIEKHSPKHCFLNGNIIYFRKYMNKKYLKCT